MEKFNYVEYVASAEIENMSKNFKRGVRYILCEL